MHCSVTTKLNSKEISYVIKLVFKYWLAYFSFPKCSFQIMEKTLTMKVQRYSSEYEHPCMN